MPANILVLIGINTYIISADILKLSNEGWIGRNT